MHMYYVQHFIVFVALLDRFAGKTVIYEFVFEPNEPINPIYSILCVMISSYIQNHRRIITAFIRMYLYPIGISIIYLVSPIGVDTKLYFVYTAEELQRLRYNNMGVWYPVVSIFPSHCTHTRT